MCFSWMTYQQHFYANSLPALLETVLCVTSMESQDFSIFLKPKILKSQAEHGSEITRRFAMNRVGRMYGAAMQDRSIRLYMADNGQEMQKIPVAWPIGLDSQTDISIDLAPKPFPIRMIMQLIGLAQGYLKINFKLNRCQKTT